MSRPSRIKSTRGAVIIHVAIALFALLAFTTFVIDYGVMWASRRQAQNVADAGALAGALAMIFDGGNATVVNQAAQHWASINPIWGQGNSAANVDVTLSGPTTSIPPCGTDPGCVRVDVFRNAPDRSNTVRGNAIPTYFANILGINEQRVRATATAETAAGNQIKCLLPFAVADRWSDATDENVNTTNYANDGDHLTGDPIGGWSPNDLYQDAIASPPGLDSYVAPFEGSTLGLPGGHTGWTVNGDYGRQLILKDGEVGQFSSGWANKVDLPGSVGSADYRWDIKNCNETPVGIAQPGETCAGYPNSGTTIPEAAAGCLGVSSGLSQGPTDQGIEGGGPGGPSVFEQDPNAVWNPSVTGPEGLSGAVVNSTSDPTLNMSSDRIRPIAIFDIAHYMQNPACVNQAGTGCVIRVANIVGFFVEGMCDTVRAAGGLEPGNDCGAGPAADSEVVGRIVTLPSIYIAGAGNVAEDAAFLRIVRLVR
jgi:hypothetical protein